MGKGAPVFEFLSSPFGLVAVGLGVLAVAVLALCLWITTLDRRMRGMADGLETERRKVAELQMVIGRRANAARSYGNRGRAAAPAPAPASAPASAVAAASAGAPMPPRGAAAPMPMGVPAGASVPPRNAVPASAAVPSGAAPRGRAPRPARQQLLRTSPQPAVLLRAFPPRPRASRRCSRLTVRLPALAPATRASGLPAAPLSQTQKASAEDAFGAGLFVMQLTCWASTPCRPPGIERRRARR